MATIAKPSIQSLLLRMRNSGNTISTGTGFVAESQAGPVLVTNWHNLAGRHPETEQPLSDRGALPDEVEILHNRASRLGEWVSRTEPLNEEGRILWHEHPQLGAKADMVALPLTAVEDVDLHPYDLTGGQPIFVGPSDPVSVIGFPFGLQAGGSLAVWATGFMASEPDINFNGLPVILVDCRTRPGQSGSAVVAYRSGGAVRMAGGGTSVFAEPVWRFLGLYSGRINPDSDIGTVWKASAVAELVASVG